MLRYSATTMDDTADSLAPEASRAEKFERDLLARLQETVRKKDVNFARACIDWEQVRGAACSECAGMRQIGGGAVVDLHDLGFESLWHHFYDVVGLSATVSSRIDIMSRSVAA